MTPVDATGWSWPLSTLSRVVDGDTVVVLVSRDLGFNGVATFTVRVRLNRINAPAIHSARGVRARDRVAALLAAPFGMTTLKPYKYGGEWMGEITLPDGRNLSDVLVAEGLAVPWDGTGPRPADT